jgi:HEAT repeat protein
VAVPKLVSLVEDPSVADAHLKGEAMAGLVRLGGATAMAAVLRQLDNEDPYVREGAQAALAGSAVPLAGYDPRQPAAANAKVIQGARAWWQVKFSKAWED